MLFVLAMNKFPMSSVLFLTTKINTHHGTQTNNICIAREPPLLPFLNENQTASLRNLLKSCPDIKRR